VAHARGVAAVIVCGRGSGGQGHARSGRAREAITRRRAESGHAPARRRHSRALLPDPLAGSELDRAQPLSRPWARGRPHLYRDDNAYARAATRAGIDETDRVVRTRTEDSLQVQRISRDPRLVCVELRSRGMLSQLGPVPDLASFLEKYRYHQDVFVFPPWVAIFRTDGERDQ